MHTTMPLAGSPYEGEEGRKGGREEVRAIGLAQATAMQYRAENNGGRLTLTVCLPSSQPTPAVNMTGLSHSTRSPLGRRCPKERAKPHTTGSPYLLP